MRVAAWILSAGLSGLLLTDGSLRAESNIDPGHAVISSDWIGQLNWLPGNDHGASINQYYCSGYIYGAQIGFISLGTGVPADKFHYKNNSASDFGVNVLPGGALRGYAYGANIGWINFEGTGNPNIDWATGRLQGKLWSANTGWISLNDGAQYVSLAFLPEALDSDGDGLPDAWEIDHAGDLTSLSGNEDSDGDGQTDLDEYLAGTDPLDPKDFLGPVKLIVSADTAAQTLQWPTKKNYTYLVESRRSFGASSNWTVVEGSQVVGTGSTVSFSLPKSSGAYLFYRIRAFPPLSSGDLTVSP